jgi:hypothetical protein
MSDIIRTRKDGCFQVRSNVWGQFLAPCDDPEAFADLEKGALDKFELHPDIHRIPADLWSRWVQLCFHFAHLRSSDLEVSCRLLRQEDDRSQWRIIVPRQEVTGGSVRIDSFDEAIDIATGELIAQYPPQGWVPAGSSHSHHSMTLDKFSSTDDASELGCPGLHIVISHVDVTTRRYKPTASITANHRRFYLPDAAAVIDLKPTAETFHPAVLDVVQPERPRLSPWLSGHISQQPNGRNQRLRLSERDLTSWDDDYAVMQKRHNDKSHAKAATLSADSDAVLDFEDTLHSLWEAVALCFTAADAAGVDRESALAEIIDAVRTTYSSQTRPLDSEGDNWLDGYPSITDDNPILWFPDDEPDSTLSSTDRHHPPTAQQLLDGEW